MDLERALEEAFFDACGRPWRPDRTIHPQDEMYTWLETVGVEPACRRAAYMRGGHESLAVLEHVARSLDTDLGAVGPVLDFASGYGRLTRFLVQAVDPDRVWCAEILPDAVEFVGERFGVQALASTAGPEDLELEQRFGLIFAGSLFSHLPRPAFGAWLRRLYDLLTPGGVLVFSTHGHHEFHETEPDPSGFTFLRQSESANLSTEDYGATWVEAEVVQAIADEVGVGPLRHAAMELWGSQDLFLAARDPRRIEAWTPTPAVVGGFLRRDVDPSGHAWIGGWARTRASQGPLEEVRLVLPQGLSYPAHLGPPEPWGPGEAFEHREWYLEGDTSNLPRGSHPLCLIGRSASGGSHCFDVGPLVLT